MAKITTQKSDGFTIIELMIAMALFLIISGSILSGMANMQVNYRTSAVNAAMHQQLRSTMELMAQEIGQAGLQASSVEGAGTDGIAGATPPFTIAAVSAGSNQNFTPTAANGVSLNGIYVGEWLNVDGGALQDPIQVTQITPTYQATFQYAHAAGTPVYPMGVFPHGILDSPQSVSAVTGSKLAMFGELNGSGNGLWAVEYACPSAFPGSLTRTAWNLLSTPLTATKANLIDNVTQCYFCWPSTAGSGSPGTGNANCPAFIAAPDSVILPPSATPSSMITQVGFTITALENVTISGSTQPVTITKSYSNIQPRNIITADKIYNAAVTSATNANNGTQPSYYFYGELQPDPPTLASVPW